MLTLIFIIYEINQLVQPKHLGFGTRLTMSLLSFTYIIWSVVGLFTEWQMHFYLLFTLGAVTSILTLQFELDKEKIKRLDSVVSLLILLSLFYNMILF